MDEGRLITTWIRIWWWGAGSMMALSYDAGHKRKSIRGYVSIVICCHYSTSSIIYGTWLSISHETGSLSQNSRDKLFTNKNNNIMCAMAPSCLLLPSKCSNTPVQHEMLLSRHGISHVWHVSFTCQIIKSESISWRACMTTSWCGLC